MCSEGIHSWNSSWIKKSEGFVASSSRLLPPLSAPPPPRVFPTPVLRLSLSPIRSRVPLLLDVFRLRKQSQDEAFVDLENMQLLSCKVRVSDNSAALSAARVCFFPLLFCGDVFSSRVSNT